MKYTKTVRASKNVKPARRQVRASAMASRKIHAEEDIEVPEMDAELPEPAADVEPDVTVDEVASTLLFEAEDVAELIAEVTDQPVDVTVDEDEVEFAIGDDVYTITPEGDEEIVEESTRLRKGARRVSASRRVSAARRVARPARRVAASRAPKASARRVAASRRVQK